MRLFGWLRLCRTWLEPIRWGGVEGHKSRSSKRGLEPYARVEGLGGSDIRIPKWLTQLNSVVLDGPMSNGQASAVTARQRFIDAAKANKWKLTEKSDDTIIAEIGVRYIRATFDVRGRITHLSTRKWRMSWDGSNKLARALEVLTLARAV